MAQSVGASVRARVVRKVTGPSPSGLPVTLYQNQFPLPCILLYHVSLILTIRPSHGDKQDKERNAKATLNKKDTIL